MYHIEGRIQHYAWGGFNYIPTLIAQINQENKPFAEFWLGVHDGGPTKVILSENAHTNLKVLVNSDKARYLGEKTYHAFGKLPFLLKILDVKDMLSIQVHPNKIDAEKGFLRENALGIDLNASNRNYKDDNHKPELMIALSDFWLLHGFSKEIDSIIESYPFFKEFENDYKHAGIKGLYQSIMSKQQFEIDRILQPLADDIIPAYDLGKLEKTSPDFWAARAMKTFQISNGKFDRGIFSIYLFNILHLKPGQVIFQGAGMPHAYMEGQNIELMSNSDNVLRAGLTPKHVDIPELMANTVFEPTLPNVIDGNLLSNHQEFIFEVPDFKIETFYIEPDRMLDLKIESPTIFLSLNGEIEWDKNHIESQKKLSSIFASPGEKLSIKSKCPQTIFKASAP